MDASKAFLHTQTRLNSPHLRVAKSYWLSHLRPHDCVIDMTCGNGHDTKFLSQHVPQGMVLTLDIQEKALNAAKTVIGDAANVLFLQQSHSMPLSIEPPSPPRLIIYNLGYLPGGDKEITTQAKSTLASLELALKMLGEEGAISVTCYPGHPAGFEEEREIIAWAKVLDPTKWRVCLHQWINRAKAPSLLWLEKL